MDFNVTITADNLDPRLLLGLLLTTSHQSFRLENSNKISSDCDEGRWYDMNSDMTQISTEFPDTLFTVDCVDECGGNWREYYKNGKHYSVKPVYPEFDESKLGE